MKSKFIVKRDYHNTRFDRWFKHNVSDLPQSLIEKLIRKNKIKVNKKKTKTKYRVQSNDEIEIFNLENIKHKNKSEIKKYKPSNKETNTYSNFIIEDNNNFVVINKPAGIPVQSGTKSFKNIIDIIKNTKYFNNSKPYIVHRLDKETSGVMIIAKNREYAQLFTSLFRIRKIHKLYIAVAHGSINKELQVMKDDLILYEKNKKVIQKAISYIKVLKSNDKYSFVELKPITGRKHQLRKQLFNIGHPVVGDDKYSFRNTKNDKNLLLHAYKIKFMINKNKYNFKADYGDNFKNFIKNNIKF
jgi:23S rRNA pseudouridine955/2504/2580 synthase